MANGQFCNLTLEPEGSTNQQVYQRSGGHRIRVEVQTGRSLLDVDFLSGSDKQPELWFRKCWARRKED